MNNQGTCNWRAFLGEPWSVSNSARTLNEAEDGS
jgi:hypothetical protein